MGKREERRIEEIEVQVSKLVMININLQAKLTEMLIRLTDLLKEVRETNELLRKASEVEVEVPPLPPVNLEPLVEQLKQVAASNQQMIGLLSEILAQLKRMHTRGLITRALRSL